MNRNSLITNALAPAVLLATGFFNCAMGQDTSIIRALPEISPTVSNHWEVQNSFAARRSATRQDLPELNQPARPDQQDSLSDTVIQQRENDLKRQQESDSQQLIDQLDDPTIASLFEQGKWPRKGIRAISLDIREKNEKAPQDVATKLLDSQTGRWSSFTPTPKVFAWAAPDIRYQPLYFEEVALERYGQSKGPMVQSVRSGVHFFTSFGLLPWHLYQDPPGSCDYPLGFCRPGDNAPCTQQHLFYRHAEK